MQATMIHGETGTSSYFQGAFKGYGRHQWNVKAPFPCPYTEEQLDIMRCEVADRGWIANELGLDRDGKEIQFFFAGRSGGWLTTDGNLARWQINRISKLVKVFKSGAWVTE